MPAKNWFDLNPSVMYRQDYDEAAARAELFALAARTNRVLRCRATSGIMNKGRTMRRHVAEKMEVLGIRLLSELGNEKIYYKSDTTVSVTWYKHNRYVAVKGWSLDPEVIRWIDALKKVVHSPPRTEPSGAVYALLENMGGTSIQQIGTVQAKLIRENYAADVLRGYDQVVADLMTDAPKGRFAIFDGPPGTGKTFLLRTIFSAAPRCHFVLVPPSLVGKLGDPGMLTTLLQARRQNSPLVLVLEDADSVIAVRERESMGALQTALNLGDGVLGDLINIRVIATTNSPIENLDPAIMRPGRLSARVRVDRLPMSQAQVVLKRLLSDAKIESDVPQFQVNPTLAEIYGAALDLGWVPDPKARGVLKGDPDAVDDDDDADVEAVNE